MIAAAIVAEVITMLHADSAGNLANWTEDELYGYLNRNLQFAHARSNYLSQMQTQPAFLSAIATMPADLISVIEVIWNGRSITRRTMAQMDALKSEWETDSADDPEAAIFEQQGSSLLRLTPIPAVAGTLQIVYQATAPTQSSVSGLAVPQCVDAITTLRTLADANSKEGRWQFPESASFAASLAEIVESAAMTYYGEAA